ncbi:MAG: urate hydroxylase PuuD, partial [Litorivicinus sp.]
GFALLAVTYYYGANTYLVDAAVADLSAWQAIAISVASLVGGWVFFDQLCKSKLGENLWVLAAIIFVFLMAAGWAYSEIFSARATLLHVGAMIATWMTGNVFFIIIPNQKKVVATLKAGGKADPTYGKVAKQRSTFNNYLTLPVLFMMLSNHYPMTYGIEDLWLVVGLVILIGATIRSWFNFGHEGRTGLARQWQWPVAGVLTIALAWLLYVPPAQPEVGEVILTDEQASALVQTHCVACHGPVLAAAMKGVQLHTLDALRQHKDQVYAQAVASKAMPMGNGTGMTDAERRALGLWIQAQ